MKEPILRAPLIPARINVEPGDLKLARNLELKAREREFKTAKGGKDIRDWVLKHGFAASTRQIWVSPTAYFQLPRASREIALLQRIAVAGFGIGHPDFAEPTGHEEYFRWLAQGRKQQTGIEASGMGLDDHRAAPPAEEFNAVVFGSTGRKFADTPCFIYRSVWERLHEGDPDYASALITPPEGEYVIVKDPVAPLCFDPYPEIDVFDPMRARKAHQDARARFKEVREQQQEQQARQDEIQKEYDDGERMEVEGIKKKQRAIKKARKLY